jgi:hypothetical protein
MISLGTWIGALLTLAVFSFLYKENPFFRVAEHLLIGVAAGYALVTYWESTLLPVLFQPLLRDGKLLLLIPLALGLLLFLRFAPRWAWLGRISLAFVLGAVSGAAIPAYTQAQIIKQVQSTMLPLSSFAHVVVVAGVCTVLLYFFFSRKQHGFLGSISHVGIYFLMVFFGATFGYTVMSRISLLIGRMQFLLGDWLGVLR